ncbi:MAG: MaoC family dehydratase [Pseudomonadota bacterium]
MPKYMPVSVAGLAFGDISVGMAADLMKTVMATDVVGFAELSGDNNPVHLSAHFAAKTPFKDRIAHGLYTASLISTLLGTRLPGPGAIYLTQTLNFRAPVRIGDVIHAHVEVMAIDKQKNRVTLATTCSVDNRIVLDGEAAVMVPAA